MCLVSPNSVFFNTNYVTETSRDPVLDKQTLMIFDEVLARAACFESRHGSAAAILPHDASTESGAVAHEW